MTLKTLLTDATRKALTSYARDGFDFDLYATTDGMEVEVRPMPGATADGGFDSSTVLDTRTAVDGFTIGWDDEIRTHAAGKEWSTL